METSLNSFNFLLKQILCLPTGAAQLLWNRRALHKFYLKQFLALMSALICKKDDRG